MVRSIFFAALLLLVSLQNVFAAGAFTPEQYKKALWMVTRFYGAQRSGEGPNWLLMDHSYKTSFTKDAADGRDLAGGWFDCGDHVLFGQTFFYSAYMLAKAYETFPEGFHDLYDGENYSDYAESGDWSIDGGKPNGIPDLLEELKYATDWIIKATPNGTTFYYEKGHGDKDHKNWVTAGFMSTLDNSEGGEKNGSRDIFKNPNDGVMASFAAGTLAIMSKIYHKYDSVYADTCLNHAKNAYTYASGKKNNSAGAASGSYYGAHKDPQTVFVMAASEMYMATNENTYKNAIDENQVKDHGWAFDYSNSHDLAAYAVAMALPDKRDTHLKFMLDNFIEGKYTKQKNTEKISTVGNAGWGALRYPANHAFSTALYSNAKDISTYDQFIYDQVDYILGSNNAKQSFIVGFCEGCSKQATKPHHRNVYLNDNNPGDAERQSSMSIPERNKYFGYMVGGSFNSNNYQDDINVYQYTEGGLDYNAGLLGALAYIVSKEAPADTAAISKPPIIVPIISQRSEPQLQNTVVRFTGTHIFPAQNKNFTVRIFNLKGDIVSVIKSEGQAVKFTPQNIGAYYAVIK